jgi:oligoribonuclease NrnB/cAMP/cGMP phosphodiesterase (DHH superfamily)
MSERKYIDRSEVMGPPHKRMYNVMVISHSDLDGISPIILAKHFFGPGNVDYRMCSYNNINDVVRDVIAKDCSQYDYIFITDISVDEDVAEIIESLKHRDDSPTVVLIDHHPTAEWLNKYTWANVTPIDPSTGEKTAATNLFYSYLKNTFTRMYLVVGEGYDALEAYVEAVRRYDTWEWTTKYQDIIPKKINDLYYLIGKERFMNRMLNNRTVLFSPEEISMLNEEEIRIKNYAKKKLLQMTEAQFLSGRFGVVYAEQYISEVGNFICNERKDLDFIMLIDMGQRSVSLRSLEVNVFEIAKRYGGGGHPNSAGFPLPEDAFDLLSFLNTKLPGGGERND